MSDKEDNERIQSLLLKGFNANEIAKMLALDNSKVQDVSKDFDTHNISKNSEELYSELQKDLSKLVFTEMGKEKRDPSVVLQAIRLQADLQEKKLNVSARSGALAGNETISKSYIYKRDEEIAKLKADGLSEEQLAAKFAIGVMSIKQSLDRTQLKLPEELRALNPSIISETIGLDRETRIKILTDALANGIKRADVRDIVVKYKNSSR